jgi:hypothetical protein
MTHFNGHEYKTEIDHQRLTSQLERIRGLMLDGKWRTLAEIEEITGDPAASVSAQLRHLRKERFGSFVVNRRSRGDREKGLFEYQLIDPRSDVAYSELGREGIPKGVPLTEIFGGQK